MGRGEMGLMCDGGLGLRCGFFLESDVSLCACSRGGFPAQAVVQQPDQHHHQRGVHRTDGASISVRRGAVGFGLSLGLAALCLHGCGDLFPQA
jgi:hypothetical protein